MVRATTAEALTEFTEVTTEDEFVAVLKHKVAAKVRRRGRRTCAPGGQQRSHAGA